ncbi:MAG: hypothetical protein V2A61_08340 [Calditrichota bacterium]
MLIVRGLFVEALTLNAPIFAQPLQPNEWLDAEWEETQRGDEFWWMLEAWPLDTAQFTLANINEMPSAYIPPIDTASSQPQPQPLPSTPSRQADSPSWLDRKFLKRLDFLHPQATYQIRTQRRYGVQTDDNIGHYNGSPWAVTQRLWGEAGKVRFGAVLDKDAFEPSAADLWRAWLAVKKDWGSVVMGDYHITVGRGLTIWTKPSYFEAFDIPGAYRRTPRGLEPAGDSAENSSLRGAAAQVFRGRTEFLAFVSDVKLDAIREGEGRVLRLSDSGLHRTPGENLKRDAVEERCVGGSINHRFAVGEKKELTIYTTGFANQYQPGLQPEPDKRTPHPLSGRFFQALGIGGTYAGPDDYLRWESSRDKYGHIASEVGYTRYFRPQNLTLDASAAHIPEGFRHPRMRLSINEAAAGQDLLALLLSGKSSRYGLDSWKAHFEAHHYPHRTYTVPRSFTAHKSSLELSFKCAAKRSMVLRLRYRAGLEGNGETIPPDRIQEYRLRLTYILETGILKQIGFKVWGESVSKIYLGNRLDTGNALGGDIDIPLSKSDAGGDAIVLELQGCCYSTENKLPIYLGEAFPRGRWTAVRLSGQGLRGGAAVEWRWGSTGWLGLAAARSFSLDRVKVDGDWEAFANMALTVD